MRNRDGRMLAWMAAAGLLLATCGCGDRAVVPASYSTYQSTDSPFRIEYPAQWEAKGGGRTGYAWASFTSGSAEIAVDTNTAGSAIGDMARTGGPMAAMVGVQTGSGDGVPLTPVGAVHRREKADFERDTGVAEQEPAAVRTGFGESQKSEFTGAQTFGGTIHGYRVTALGLDYRFRVVCKCPESEWNDLKPAFDKVIESLAPRKH